MHSMCLLCVFVSSGVNSCIVLLTRNDLNGLLFDIMLI